MNTLYTWKAAFKVIKASLPVELETRLIGYYAKTVENGELTIEEAVERIIEDSEV
jgi:hypothetical protein